MRLSSRFRLSLNLFLAGYALAVWLIFASLGLGNTIFDPAGSSMGLVATGLLLPLLTLAFSAEGFAYLNSRVRVALNGYLRRGEVTRLRIVNWGMATGTLLALGVALLWVLVGRFSWWGVCAALVGTCLFFAIFPALMFLQCAQRITGRRFPDPPRKNWGPWRPRRVDEDELDWMEMQREVRDSGPPEGGK